MNTTPNSNEPTSAPLRYIKSLYRFALICGALCLILAVAAGAAIETSGHSLSVPLAALWMGISGLFMFLFLVALVWALIADRKVHSLVRGAGWRAALLLLAPFAAYAVQRATPPATFTIAVQNDTPDVLHAAEIGGACCATQLGDIAPHQTRKAVLRIDNDGDFSLFYSRSGHKHSNLIDGYLGIGENGSQHLTVNADGTVDGVRKGAR